MENPPTSVGAALIQPFSQCVNGIVLTTRSLVRSRFVQRHGKAALTAAEINLPKRRVRELLMKKG